jgi:hypothetical protein
VSYAAINPILPKSGTTGAPVGANISPLPISALEISELPLATLRTVRGRFNLSLGLDWAINREVRDFLAKTSTLEAVLYEFTGTLSAPIIGMSFSPERTLGSGHSRVGVKLKVTLRSEAGENVSQNLVLKMERDPYTHGRIIGAADGGRGQGEDIELSVSKVLKGAAHGHHFVRTIASFIGLHGDRIALETCAQGEPLAEVLSKRYEVGLAAAVQALTVMSETWNSAKDHNGQGILFDSGLDDILVAGTTPKNVSISFVDFHRGHYLGQAHVLLFSVARLMIEVLSRTSPSRENQLLAAFSPELIREKVLDPLRGQFGGVSPERYLAFEYESVQDWLKLAELGNPWDRVHLYDGDRVSGSVGW